MVAATLTGVLALLLGAPGPGAAALAMALVGLSVVAVSRRACRLLGGQTGDVLGASVLLAECAALVGMAALT